MRVRFASRDLAHCYESEREAVRAWGQVVGRRYIDRVSLIRQARSLRDLHGIRSLRLHQLRGDRAGELAIRLTGQWRLVCRLADGDDVIVEEVSAYYGD